MLYNTILRVSKQLGVTFPPKIKELCRKEVMLNIIIHP